jgi:hypothetical protein
MPVLVQVLKTDRMDVEAVKLTLETLGSVCLRDDSPQHLGAMFSEIFVKVCFNLIS